MRVQLDIGDLVAFKVNSSKRAAAVTDVNTPSVSETYTLRNGAAYVLPFGLAAVGRRLITLMVLNSTTPIFFPPNRRCRPCDDLAHIQVP
jgi:hypothetical protein